MPASIGGDGLIFGNMALNGPWRLFVMPVNGAAPARPLLDLAADAPSETSPAVSPDGRFVAYTWDVPEGPQIYVRPTQAPAARRWPVSTTGGRAAAWSRDGRELFFLDLTGHLMSSRVDTSGHELRSEPPVRVLARTYSSELQSYDVSPDGKRFLMMKPTGARPPAPRFTVLVNVLPPR
jgi:Tol biopolymer transport system component